MVFTDGEDTSSLVGFDELLDLAKRSETAIYAIGLRSPVEIAARTYAETDFSLRQLAQQTGGRAFFPTRIEDLAGVYGQIADELASQYVVGFVSKNTRRDGAWRKLIVRVGSRGHDGADQAGVLRAEAEVDGSRLGSARGPSRLRARRGTGTCAGW